MPRFTLNKLVRDKIVDSNLESGAKVKYKHLNKDEHKTALVNKIIEEAKEILQAETEQAASEIADVQQAVDDLIEQFGLDQEAIKKSQKQKIDKNGAFKKGHYIEHLDLDESHPFTEYYRKDPERFPES
jgi:predicted house-cleaning noncanonical NTP pyrophosphatase (MazG superfamily)